ncbi:MAG TPA: 4Fe-4S binding protein [Spirochaetota bacterium]|nr:4Fe-4S binding protein [Spirochaetota bacterium]HOR43427.1 4Fe-4S binding protein [Spirochaetota bacterium]HOU83452.1 4Fe-4S binding protein [Spirochaetota bacterium]HPK56381.1 4Fe-4S binding protein [Spirochaetota bacterium]HQE58412.1 4Fe-4S binding protein [Spirochaetota bacterium]
MAYFITEQCVNCGVCEPECPVNAIRENADKRIIDSDKCTECGICASVCPVQAIEPPK